MKKLNVMCSVLLAAFMFSCSFDTEPPPPGNLRITVDDEWWQCILRWEAVPGATGYYLYRWTDDYDDEKRYGYTDVASNYFNIPDRRKTWYFAVRTEKNGQESVLSDIVIVEGDPSIPEPTPVLLESAGSSGPKREGEEKNLSSERQWFNPAVHAAKKSAWEAHNIHKYRFTAARLYVNDYPGARLPPYFTITVFPDKKPEMICDQEGYYDCRDPFSSDIIEGKTIDEFFVSIPQTVIDYPRSYKWYIVYNETYHYPELFGYSGYFPYSGYPVFYLHKFEVLEE